MPQPRLLSDAATDIHDGGGVAALLAANRSLTGVRFDQRHVVTGAASVFEAAAVAGRVPVEGGDFFAAVPPGGDIYMLSHALHDWGDEDAVRILTQCRASMSGESVALLVELIVPSGNDPHPAKLMDLHMLLINVGGRERTEREWRTLLERAGFEVSRIIPTASLGSLIEARPRPSSAPD